MKGLKFREMMLIVLMLTVAIVMGCRQFVWIPLKASIEQANGEYSTVLSGKESKDNVINGKEFREENIGILIGDIESLESTYAVDTTHENIDLILTTLVNQSHLVTSAMDIKLLSETEESAQRRAEELAKAQSTDTTKQEDDELIEMITTAENGLILEAFSYSISGNYLNMLDFLEYLNSDDKVQIPNFSISYDKEAPTESAMSIQINIKELDETYVYARDTIPDEFQYLNISRGQEQDSSVGE